MAKPAPGELTALGFVVLGLLAEQPMHPYEMYQTLIDRQKDRMVKIRPGSLYHTVARLADRRLIRSTGTDRAGNRPERTVYELTKDGRSAQTEWCSGFLGTPIREYPVFSVALAEAHNLPRDEVVELLRARVDRQEAEIAELAEMRRRMDEAGVPRRYGIGNDYQLALVRAEVAWLRELIADMESDRVPWIVFDEEAGLTREPENDVVRRWGWSRDPAVPTVRAAQEKSE